MARAITRAGSTTFAYDALGRRIAKHSEVTRTMYGWDGDTLALESSVRRGHAAGERTVHYLYERDSFLPLVQATRSEALQLTSTTDVKALMASNDGRYDLALDPLWNGETEQETEPFGKHEIAFYQCDHLGTPQELTDCEGKVAWSAQYKAWGEAKQAISEAANKAGARNPIRFQGQYFDEETGLHYNRFRYYDPSTGRFVSQDPIGVLGGENLFVFAPNSTEWVDPLGLCPIIPERRSQTAGDVTLPTARAARRAAMRAQNIPTSRSYSTILRKEGVDGSGGIMNIEEIREGGRLSGGAKELGEIKVHPDGHQFPSNEHTPCPTYELPHYHGLKGEHISYQGGSVRQTNRYGK
jgi:RHS repeat-associated protein